MSEDQQTQIKEKLPSEGFIIAALPVAAAMITFSYEAGYAKAYGIPLELITIGLTDILIAFGVLIVSYGLVIPIILNMGAALGEPKDALESMHRRVVRYSFVAFFILYPFYVYWGWRGFIVYLSTVAGAVIFSYGVPLVTQKKIEGYRNKVAASEKVRWTEYKGSLRYKIDQRFGSYLTASIMYLIIGLGFVFALGNVEATSRINFPVLMSDEDTVVLRIYGDTVVSARVDRAKKQLVFPLSIHKISDKSDLKLKFEKIGPLAWAGCCTSTSYERGEK